MARNRRPRPLRASAPAQIRWAAPLHPRLPVRVAWIAANREQLPDPVVPIGLLQVAAALADRHELLHLDLCFEEDPVSSAVGFVGDARPDLVAIGLRNLHDNDWGPPDAAIRALAALVAALREVTGAPILLGGGGFSVLPGPLLEATGADFGIAGEGEVAAGLLLDALEAGGDPASVPGVWRLVEGRAVRPSRPAPAADLEALPIVDRRLVDRRHHLSTGIESVQTHRGCPLTCAWCTYPDIEGRFARLRPPAKVVEEFLHIRATAPEVNHVFVVDSVFNLPRRHAMEVCRALAEHGSPLPWTCYLNPLGLTPQLARAMHDAGCVGAEMGVDSGHDAVLKRLRKGFDTRRIREACAIARDAGIKVCPTWLLATPGETMDEVRTTLEFAASLPSDAQIFMVWNDASHAVEPLSPDQRSLREATLDLLRQVARSHPHWIVPPLRHRFNVHLFRSLRRRGFTGPLWQHLPTPHA